MPWELHVQSFVRIHKPRAELGDSMLLGLDEAVSTALDPTTYPSITVRTRAQAFGALLDEVADSRTPAVREWREIAQSVYQPIPPLNVGYTRKELPWAANVTD